jgi:RHS repeat-associated protein
LTGNPVPAMGLRELRAPTSANYVHPDHLGSTNVVTDQNQDLVQTLDYYPYGATRISNSTSTNEKRKFIGQFSNETNLSYLNARYYNPSQGQFISQDSFSAIRLPSPLNESYGRTCPAGRLD